MLHQDENQGHLGGWFISPGFSNSGGEREVGRVGECAQSARTRITLPTYTYTYTYT